MDLLGVSRSMEYDLLCVLSIYPRILLRVFIYTVSYYGYLTVFKYSYYMFMCSNCGLVVSTCQVIGYKDRNGISL